MKNEVVNLCHSAQMLNRVSTFNSEGEFAKNKLCACIEFFMCYCYLIF